MSLLKVRLSRGVQPGQLIARAGASSRERESSTDSRDMVCVFARPLILFLLQPTLHWSVKCGENDL